MSPRAVPGLTVCRSCAGERLGDGRAGQEAQLARYAAIEEAGVARITAVDCLDQCGKGDAIVVRPVREHRATAGPVWLAGLVTPDATQALRAWLAAGGPGHSALPTVLAPYVVGAPDEGEATG
ncbi:hypothetical protein OEB99_10095 [Actinotalea sp. M2MS4P-6]|uniref:hypothetical protein n=1 Tax=Actinotalea sp. M2MS4P-6 TaxID=2983762 RepID=UPI0021E4B6C2|nr:hypothetical protein [Actinotalea sp. M2MS4P-6]MCV2394658.1 hypothetical protein [Actinotalea sp. M2MS4P-6]